MKIYVYISILCVEFSSSLDLSKVVGNISIVQNEICSYSGEPQIISNQIPSSVTSTLTISKQRSTLLQRRT